MDESFLFQNMKPSLFLYIFFFSFRGGTTIFDFSKSEIRIIMNTHLRSTRFSSATVQQIQGISYTNNCASAGSVTPRGCVK